MKQRRTPQTWLLLTVLLGGLALGVWGWSSHVTINFGALLSANGNALAAQPDQIFTPIDDAQIQQRELLAYVDARQQPHRVVQVDLARHPKISQFIDIDSSASGYGKNACALVAAAAALGGKDWTPLVDRLAKAAGKDYDGDRGIQPSKYTAALQVVFGAENVQARDNGALGYLYQELASGHVVIVDIKVNATSRMPSVKTPNYAHFARVLGLDLDRQEIYLENTLAGDPYWTVSLENFVATWLRPETTVSDILAPREAENVTRWLVSISNPNSPS